jgi:hypothetical protein
VTELPVDRSGAISGVVYVHDGQRVIQRCRHVFLCGGAIETPHLLLINGLANASGQVGKNFMAHTGLQVWDSFEEMTRPYKGIPGGPISEDTHRPHDANFAGGYLLQSIGVMLLTYAGQVARGRGPWGDALVRHMRGYNHVAGINILGECLPHNDNDLLLSNELDGRGLPKPPIRFTAHDNEVQLTAHADRLMRLIWEAAGAHDLWAYERYAHTIGTARMGRNSRTSVVNADRRAHDVINLTICDNSVFPSALAANPALTIMALSLRTADRFLANEP